MTRGSEPSDPPSPDSLSSESERRRWQHKRAQFDTAINTARLLGVVQNLALGSMQASEALRIILEVNASKDQARYVAEMLAMKKEFRDLARLEYSPEVAKFILEGSRLVPALTGGLASQMLMAMGHAAQNDAYLETVSSAVSTLLSDLDHPLMPDARNYLRLLWDQMEATRRLTQTEALYTGHRVPSERAVERRSSGSLAAVKVANAGPPEGAKPAVAAPDATAPVPTGGSISPSRTMIGIGQAPLVAHAESPEPATLSKKRWVEAAPGEVQPPVAPVERPSPRPVAPSLPVESNRPARPSAPASKRWVEAEAHADEAAGAGTPSEDESSSPRQPIEPPPVAQRLAASKVVSVAEVDERRESAPKIATEPEAANSAMNIMGRVWREARAASKPPPRTEPIASDSASRLVARPEAPSRRETAPKIAPSPEGHEQPASPAPTGFEPTLLQHEQEFFATADREREETAEVPPPFAPRAPYEPSVLIADTRASENHSDTLPGARQRQASRDELKVPTRGVPKWAVATVVAVALAGSGLVLSLSLTSESENKSESPKGSASEAKKPAPSASAAAAPSLARRTPRASALPSSAAAPPSPPPASEPEPPPTPAHHVVPRTQEPVSPPVRPSKPQSTPVTPHAQGRMPAQAPVAEPTSKKPSAEPASNGPSVVTPPEVAKTLSPLDRIIAEIRLISPDPVGIEDKARELARIIARSKRKEAGQIIEKLGPPIAVDPLSRDSTLEESLQTFAVSVLGRVATDDDDNRAVDALLMLGEWVRNGGKGKQKALSALQTLSHDSIIKTSAPRLRALKTAQAQAD